MPDGENRDVGSACATDLAIPLSTALGITSTLSTQYVVPAFRHPSVALTSCCRRPVRYRRSPHRSPPALTWPRSDFGLGALPRSSRMLNTPYPIYTLGIARTSHRLSPLDRCPLSDAGPVARNSLGVVSRCG
jgi:hypothetical protein